MKALILLATVLGGTILITACTPIGTVPVQFASVPQSPDEHAVSRTLSAWVRTLNAHDLDAFVSTYVADATIESTSAGATVSRPQFRQALHDDPRLPLVTAELRQTQITMERPDRSRVEAELYMLGSRGITSRRIGFVLVRRTDQWRILEQDYPDLELPVR